MEPSSENLAQRKYVMSVIFDRYVSIIAENKSVFAHLQERSRAESLLVLCEEAVANFDNYPFDKINRWLGFVQGVLCAVGLIDVDEERDFTRPLLHSLHSFEIKTFSTNKT